MLSGRAVRDYAIWDDAHEYVSQPNRKFESDNFTQQSLTVMQLDFVAIMATPAKLVFSSEKNPAITDIRSTPPIHSAKLRALLAQLPDWSGTDAAKPTTYITILLLAIKYE